MRSLLAPSDKQASLTRLPQPRVIYIDPPYAMNVDHAVLADDGAHQFAYRDSWASDAAYCQFMFERLDLMQRWLRDDGFLFVHCDWRASAWLRVMLDELFGRSCFRNEIVWRRAPNLGRQAASKQLGRTVDSILVYSKREGELFPGVLPKLRKLVECDQQGRPINAKWDEVRSAWFTTAPRGDYTDASIERLDVEGRVHRSGTGKVYIKYFLEREGVEDSHTHSQADSQMGKAGTAVKWFKVVPLDTIWDDAGVRPVRHASKRELAVRYVTQKPESLLRRIVEWATLPGDYVADCFCGSGTTLVAACDVGRRFIGFDSSDVAWRATRARLEERGVSWREWQVGPSESTASATKISPSPTRKARVTRGR